MSTQTTFKTAGSASAHCDLALVQNAASSAPGDPILGLAYNTSGLQAYYRVGMIGAVTSITLATQTVTGAYSSGGFVQLSATEAPGGYRFDIPAAVIASTGEANIWFSGTPAGSVGNMETHLLKIICTGINFYDAIRGGMTALPPDARLTGTVTNSAFTPTSTAFESSQLNNANVGYYIGLSVYPSSGLLAGRQQRALHYQRLAIGAGNG
jgi:hypothetical protein